MSTTPAGGEEPSILSTYLAKRGERLVALGGVSAGVRDRHILSVVFGVVSGLRHAEARRREARRRGGQEASRGRQKNSMRGVRKAHPRTDSHGFDRKARQAGRTDGVTDGVTMWQQEEKRASAAPAEGALGLINKVQVRSIQSPRHPKFRQG
jgi:hypothetical protein